MSPLISIWSNGLKVCSPLKSGGLGVQNLRKFNQALLSKWLWRYGMETSHLWWQVIEIKYENILGGWCTNEEQLLMVLVFGEP